MTRLQSLLAALPALNILYDSPPLQLFSLFPRLPLEIRLMVWRVASTEQRIIKLARVEEKTASLGVISSIEGQPRHPGILGANQESRKEGLRAYELCYESVTGSLQVVYINFACDIFRLAPRYVDDIPAHVARPPVIHYRANIDDYNFSRKVLKCVERLQQVYHHELNIENPEELIKAANIHQYLMLCFRPKVEWQNEFDSVDRDLVRRSYAENARWSLEHAFPGLSLSVPVAKWKIGFLEPEQGTELSPCSAVNAGVQVVNN